MRLSPQPQFSGQFVVFQEQPERYPAVKQELIDLVADNTEHLIEDIFIGPLHPGRRHLTETFIYADDRDDERLGQAFKRHGLAFDYNRENEPGPASGLSTDKAPGEARPLKPRSWLGKLFSGCFR